MADKTSLSDTLLTLTTAAKAATVGLPEVESLLPPANGISLFDTKNEIFLSYLQALALRNLNVIRSMKNGGSLQETQLLNNEITSKLVEHRVYLERGVRLLEQKIKYQVDKTVTAADDEHQAAVSQAKRLVNTNGHGEDEGKNDDESEEDSDGEESVTNVASAEQAQYRPNITGFTPLGGTVSARERRAESKADDVYYPPRVAATSMPTTEQREKKERRPDRSATLDEYVSNELSTAPLAQPSIGSTITAGGRKQKDARQLAKEQERRDYEETNLVRLPKESKKELGMQAKRDRRGGFGGEEWRDLGASVDRIGDLTRKKTKDRPLDRSRKRAIEDSPRDDGIGKAYEIQKKRALKKMRR